MMEETPQFDAPIPGQSLTSAPRLYPWENPPQFDDPKDVIEFYIKNLAAQEVMDDIFIALDEGFPLNILVKSILSTGVMEGIHSVDVSLIVAPVLHEYILGAARLENIKVKERAISKDERLAEKEKAALAATVKSSLEKSTDDDMGRALLEDALEFVEEDMPEPQPDEEPMEEEAGEEEPQGLMARRGT